MSTLDELTEDAEDAEDSEDAEDGDCEELLLDAVDAEDAEDAEDGDCEELLDEDEDELLDEDEDDDEELTSAGGRSANTSAASTIRRSLPAPPETAYTACRVRLWLSTISYSDPEPPALPAASKSPCPAAVGAEPNPSVITASERFWNVIRLRLLLGLATSAAVVPTEKTLKRTSCADPIAIVPAVAISLPPKNQRHEEGGIIPPPVMRQTHVELLELLELMVPSSPRSAKHPAPIG